MTRRFADFSRPRAAFTWGDAIIAGIATIIPAVAFVLLLLIILLLNPAIGRDLDGKYKDSPLRGWFNSLKSANGLCCSFADGRTVADPDVEMKSGGYRVRIDGVWHDVPPEALVTVPNRAGSPIVWPYLDSDGKTQIRCFIAGAGL